MFLNFSDGMKMHAKFILARFFVNMEKWRMKNVFIMGFFINRNCGIVFWMILWVLVVLIWFGLESLVFILKDFNCLCLCFDLTLMKCIFFHNSSLKLISNTTNYLFCYYFFFKLLYLVLINFYLPPKLIFLQKKTTKSTID